METGDKEEQNVWLIVCKEKLSRLKAWLAVADATDVGVAAAFSPVLLLLLRIHVLSASATL